MLSYLSSTLNFCFEQDNTKKRSRKGKEKDSGNGNHFQPPPPPPPPPTTMDMGDFTQHWTSVFNKVHSTFEGIIATQAVAFGKLEERFDSKLDKINTSLAKLHGKSPKQENHQGSEEDGNDGDDESDEDVGRDQDMIILQVFIRLQLLNKTLIKVI
jgi:hypothetical protein